MVLELLATLALTGCGGPGPDPSPGTTRPVTCIDWTYDYRLSAVNEATGQVIPGMYFQCHHDKDTTNDICTLVQQRRFAPSRRHR